MNWIDISFYVTYAALIIALIGVLIVPLFFLAQDLKKAKSSMIGVLALVIIFGISYAISGNESYEKYGVDAGLSQQVGASLITFYIMFVLSVLFLIMSK